MADDLLNFEQVTELRKRTLAQLVEKYTQAEVARRVGRADRQVSDMIKTKSFGEKVALEMERAWRDNTGGELVDFVAPRLRTGDNAPAGWNQLDALGRAKVEAYISGLLAQGHVPLNDSTRFRAD